MIHAQYFSQFDQCNSIVLSCVLCAVQVEEDEKLKKRKERFGALTGGTAAAAGAAAGAGADAAVGSEEAEVRQIGRIFSIHYIT